jgi:predicted PurR-regulated permease PerM
VATPTPPRLLPGERLRRAGIASWSIIGILLVLAISVWLLFRISVIFPPMVLALLIIYILNPVVSRLERRRIPRLVGAVGSYVVFLGLMTLLVIALVPVISDQVDHFVEEWPRFRAQIVDFVEDTAASVENRFNTDIDTAQVTCLIGGDEISDPDAPSTRECDEVTERFRREIGEHAGRITEIGSSVLEILIVFIVGPLLALYVLIDLPQLRSDFLKLIPEAHKDEVIDVGGKLGRAVGGFFRGQLVVALLVGVLSATGFRLIGLPFWLIIGAIAGFTNLIPLIGPFIGGALGFFVGIISDGAGLGLKAVLVAVAVQQLDNHVISPNVMKRTVNLHPGTVMLALLAGGTLAGFWGLLLAVPGVAVVKIILGHVWETRVLGAEVSPYSPGSSTTPPA